MTQKTHAARLSEALLPLSQKVSKTSRDLQEWRREAGVKSKWSNHKKLLEASMFAAVETASAALTEAVVAELPAHWGMKDWAFKPARMGGEVRWAGKKGRARDDATVLETDWILLSAFIGVLIGAITKSVHPKAGDLGRMKELGLDPKRLTTFSFYNGVRHHQMAGYHPSDAQACLLAKGAFSRPYPASVKVQSQRSAIEYGDLWARNFISRDANWSAGPTLWPRLRKDPRVRKLAGAMPVMFPARPPWKNHDYEDYDRCVSMCLAMLESLPETPGPLTSFLIKKESGWGDGVSGWCGTSAVLGAIVKNLDNGKLSMEVDMWRAYALSDECGKKARRIAENYVPPMTPVED